MADHAHDQAPPPRAKSLPLVPLVGAPPDLVPARMVNEVLYCERLAYLELAQREFKDNFFTVDGRATAHKRVDAVAQAPPSPDAFDAPWRARSVWLSSERLRLTAKIDIIEADASGAVAPVEYKRGRKPDVPEGAWPPERAQLCAQVLLLRDHGYSCDTAYVWFAQSRQKVRIEITDELIDLTLGAIERVIAVTTHPRIPPPLVHDPKCKGCSLAPLCLPDEVNLLNDIHPPGTEPDPQRPSTGDTDQRPTHLRQLHPARDERAPLYVRESGATIGVQKHRLRIRSRSGEESFVRIPNTSQVCVFGHVQISTQAIRALLKAGIPVAFFTTGGWYLGRTITQDSNNIELRVAQYRTHLDEHWRLRLAQSLIHNKILNQRTLLRRNHPNPDPVALFELKQLARKAKTIDSRPQLLGIEGTAARTYFASFAGMLKGDAAVAGTFDFNGRNRRPPRDPINALLSLVYALLTKEWALTLQLAGLEPLLGFLHEPRFGRPALALDLMEPFRPLIADSVVIGVINNGEITAKDFIISATGCALAAHARRKLIAAYERRLSQLITHPLFGYRISYRRTLEVQARLLGRHLLGELDHYPPFRTR